MIKRIAFAALISTPMLAAADPGCGLGATLWEGQDGIAPHVLAATTNSTLGNQTFGMTSGTLGCDTSKPVDAVAVFVNDNMDQVAESMASGEGEALDALAALLGVETADRAAFNQLVQSQFGAIYTSEQVSAADVMTNLVAALSADSQLAKYAA
jgi:hypothetical protein